MYKRERDLITLILAVCLSVHVTMPTVACGQSHGDVFQAQNILPKAVLQGPNYHIADLVSLEAYAYVFTVKSDFGEFTAKGRDMLNLRLRELKSIEAAQELAKDPHLVNGILGPLKDTGKGANLLIDQPLETLKSMPKGFGLMVSQYLDPADRRAGSPGRRQLAVELDCDPETRNPVLKKLLDDMSLQEGGGALLTKAGMSFVPGLSLLPTTVEMKETIANSPPSVINKQINKELEAAGVAKSLRSRFCKSKAFTTAERLMLMSQFRALEGVSGRAALIESGTHADTEIEALATIREGKMLVDLGKRKAIGELDFVGLPTAVLRDGTYVLICPYDYITNTKELIDGVNAYRASHPKTTTVLATSGDASAAARKTLESSHITIVEEKIAN